MERLSQYAEITEEPIPAQPIVELSGDRQVLIENHLGVTQYCNGKIAIKVRYGQLLICGCGLELVRMTKEMLVITGRIDEISLIRRGQK